MKYIAMIPLLLLSACASYAPQAQLTQNQWQTLTCSGFKTWNDCKTQARSNCPNGFYTANSLENILIQRRQVEIACKV